VIGTSNLPDNRCLVVLNGKHARGRFLDPQLCVEHSAIHRQFVGTKDKLKLTKSRVTNMCQNHVGQNRV